MLSGTQYQTLEAIKGHVERHGVSPLISDLLTVLRHRTRNALQHQLTQLEQTGYTRRLPNEHRHHKIAITKEQKLPLLGRIAAGEPIETINDDEIIDIPNLILADDRYLLEVKGDSMIGDNICDGDLVICRHSNTAAESDIAVVLVDNAAATLKRIHHNEVDNTITLIPSNPALLPVEYAAERITIQGVYLGLLRLGTLRS